MLFIVIACALFCLGGLAALFFARKTALAALEAGNTANGAAAAAPMDRSGAVLSCTLMVAGALAAVLPAAQVLLGPGLLGGLVPVIPLEPISLGPCILQLDSLSALFLAVGAIVAGLCALHGLSPYFSGDTPAFPTFSGEQWMLFGLLAASLTLFTAAADAITFLLGCEGMIVSVLFMARFAPEEEMPEAKSGTEKTGCAANDDAEDDADADDADEADDDGEEESPLPSPPVPQAAPPLTRRFYRDAAHMSMMFIAPLFAMLIYVSRAGGGSFATLSELALPGRAVSLLFALALFGFGGMAGIAPLRFWFHEAHPAFIATGRGQASALAGAAFSLCGVYGFLRTASVLGGGEIWWGWLTIGVGVIGVLAALGPLLVRRDAPSVFAYAGSAASSVVFIVLGAGGLATAQGNLDAAAMAYSGGLMIAVSQSFAASALLLGAASVSHARRVGSGLLRGTLFSNLPLLGAAILLGMLSLALLPPLSGFCGALLGFAGMALGGYGAAQGSDVLAAGASLFANWGGIVCVALAAVFSAYGMVRLFVLLFLRHFSTVGPVVDAAASEADAAAEDDPDDALEKIVGGQSVLLVLVGLCILGSILAPDFALLCSGTLGDFVAAGAHIVTLAPAPAVAPAEFLDTDGVNRLAGLGAEARDSVFLLFMAGQGLLLLLMMALVFFLVRRRYIRDRAVETLPAFIENSATAPVPAASACPLCRFFAGDETMSRNGFSPYVQALARLQRAWRARHTPVPVLVFSLFSLLPLTAASGLFTG